MNALNSILGQDSPTAVRFAVIFFIVAIGVFVLWFVISSVMKALRRGGLVGRSRQPRLGILEETEIDARRRLLLIRRDNVEHLILLGQSGDIVIEKNIMRVAQTNVAPSQILAPQTVRETNVEEEGMRNNYRAAAKAQARTAAQVTTRPVENSPPPKIEEPKTVELVARVAPEVMHARSAQQVPLVTTPSPAPQVNMGQFSRPNPFPPAPLRQSPPPVNAEIAPSVQPPVTQTRPTSSPFDNLENEMANLLGQTRPVKAP